jgi:cold shock CspA family protein
MTTEPCQGKLTRWNDERGFGFITPAKGGQQVFMHISALGRVSRRPEVGDTITYQLMTQPDGKLRAIKASIQGVAVLPPTTSRQGPPKNRPNRPNNKPNRLWTGAATLLILTGVVLWELQTGPRTTPPPITIQPPATTQPSATAVQPDCLVKGNISHSSGAKLYHLPGMEDYDNTVIDPDQGEKWFCSEAEAIAQGWRKAPR